jgi:O-antigen ligase
VNSGRLRAALQLGVLALLVAAPLPFGSVRSGAVLGIELAAAALGLGAILLIGSDDEARAAVPVAPLALAGAVTALGVFQLVPLPFSIAERFNPTAELVRPLIPYLGLSGPPSVTWSVSSPETTDALLRFIAYALIGLATAVAFDTENARRRFAFVLIAAAVFQAVYGSGEYLTGRQHIFGYAKKYYLDSATGTLINRNHFATMLAIALPFALTLAIPRPGNRRERGWRESLVALSRGPALLRLFAIAASALLWMGLLLSHSRAGLLSALAGAAIVVFRYRGTKAARWTAALGGAVVLVLLTLELSQAPGERFFAVKDDLDAKAGRLAVWRDSRALIAARPIAGWGFGTFESAFPTVQSADIDVHYDHAHNDWLEWATDGGVLTLLAAAGLFAMAVRKGDTATRAALSAVALHAMWDFSLRIPSVAATAAAAMGLGFAAHAAAKTSRAETSAFPSPSTSDAGPVPRRFGRWIVPLVLLTCAAPIGAASNGAAAGLGGWVVPWDFEAGMQSAARGRGSIRSG